MVDIKKKLRFGSFINGVSNYFPNFISGSCYRKSENSIFISVIVVLANITIFTEIDQPRLLDDEIYLLLWKIN